MPYLPLTIYPTPRAPSIRLSQQLLQLPDQGLTLLPRPDRDPETALTPNLVAPESHHHTPVLCHLLVRLDRPFIARLALGPVEDLAQDEIGVVAAYDPADGGDALQLGDEVIAVRDEGLDGALHRAQACRGDGLGGDGGCGDGYVVWRFGVGKYLDEGWGSQEVTESQLSACARNR